MKRSRGIQKKWRRELAQLKIEECATSGPSGTLLHREAKWTEKCLDLGNRARRKNLRIYRVAEGEEKNEMIRFVTEFLADSLKLPEDINIRIERAHRSLAEKPRAAQAPPRSIIVRFLDYYTKYVMFQQAWKQGQITYAGDRVYFDQDYSPEIQRQRKEVRHVIKQLREKNINAKSPFPAQIKIFLDDGVKAFRTLTEAAPTLEKMGIAVRADVREKLNKELLEDRWSTINKGASRGQHGLTEEDLCAFLSTTREGL